MLNKGKLDANTVGAGFVSDRNKGITLIALIITIIVMLILVGVTVNVALNGGLFDTTKQASASTTRQAEKEQLISAVLGGLQTGGDFNVADINLPTDMKWCDAGDTDYNAANETGKPVAGQVNAVITKTNNKFYVDEDGNVLDEYKSIAFVIREPLLGGGNVTLNSSLKSPNTSNIDYENRIITIDDVEIDPEEYVLSSNNEDIGQWLEIYFSIDENNKLLLRVENEYDLINGTSAGEDECYVYSYEDQFTLEGITYNEGAGWYKENLDSEGRVSGYEKLTNEEIPIFNTDNILVDGTEETIEFANKYFSDVFVKK